MAVNSRTEKVENISRIRQLLVSGRVFCGGTTTVVSTVSGDVLVSTRSDTGTYTVQLKNTFPQFQVGHADLQLLTPTTGVVARIFTLSATAGTLSFGLYQQPSNSTVSALIDVAANAGNFVNLLLIANDTEVSR
jgi:hypothetical protein